MTKTCKVIWKNELVAVVDFGGVQVQVPSKELNGDEIKLRKTGGSYYIVAAEADEPKEEENA